MNDTLQAAIVGDPILVTLGGQQYPLAYPVQAVILYQRETAKIDRARRAQKLAEGGARLTRDEIKDLRRRRRELLREAYALLPEKPPYDRDTFEAFSVINDEATALKRELDEDACKGDSLFDRSNWTKVNPEEDPERFLLALWVGLHAFRDAGAYPGQYLQRLTREQIGPLVHMGNYEALGTAIAGALTAHIAPQKDEDDEVPNVPPPPTAAETTITETMPTMTPTTPL